MWEKTPLNPFLCMCKFLSIFYVDYFLQYVNVMGLACHRQIWLAVGILNPQLHTVWFYTCIIYCHMSNLHGILFMWFFCCIGTGAYSVYLYNCLTLRAIWFYFCDFHLCVDLLMKLKTVGPRFKGQRFRTVWPLKME